MTACPICEKHKAPIDSQIHRGQHTVLVHYPISTSEPLAYKGHLMVELQRHVTSFGELTEAEAAEVGITIARGVRLLNEKLGAEHAYVFSIGHLVPHLHIHLVARYPGTPEEFWDGKKLSQWPDAPMLDHGQVLALAAELRA